MTRDLFDQALARIRSDDVFRCVVAGYGEPTTHPLFEDFVEAVGEHPVNFDMVTNGQLLDARRLRSLDGRIGHVMVSFSSIDPGVYEKVHVNLDHDRVKSNILHAKKILRKTRLSISLTPLPECLDKLPQTVKWFRDNGIDALSMSPTLYNRAGGNMDLNVDSVRLRQLIRKYRLHSQEMDFIEGPANFLKQFSRNEFKCAPRNSDLLISSTGKYLYCFNDISHSQPIGDIGTMSIRDALETRQRMAPIASLCNQCNMNDRYRTGEIAGVAARYAIGALRSRLARKGARTTPHEPRGSSC